MKVIFLSSPQVERQLILIRVNNIIKKANHPDMLKFLVVDNTFGEDKNLKNYFKSNYDIRFLENNGVGLQRSVSHSSALDLGLNNLETEFCLIIDPDVHIFQSGWATFCKNAIKHVSHI